MYPCLRLRNAAEYNVQDIADMKLATAYMMYVLHDSEILCFF